MKAKDYAVLHQYEAMQIVKHRVDFPFMLYNKILEAPYTPTTETKYCQTASGWEGDTPTNAEGVEDDVCAFTNINGDILYLDDFGFSATHNPTAVDVDCKVIVVNSTVQACDFYVWDGSSWIYFATIQYQWRPFPVYRCADSYYRGWHDLSAIIDTAAKLNSIKFKAVHITGGAGGGGGFPVAWTTYIDAIKVKATH